MMVEQQTGGSGSSGGEAVLRLTSEGRDLRVELKKAEADRERLQERYDNASRDLDRIEGRVAQLEVELQEVSHAKMAAEGSLYRRLLPSPDPDVIAWWAVRGYTLGLRSVMPGFLGFIAFVALRIMPHRLVLPIVAVLLKPRGQEGPDV